MKQGLRAGVASVPAIKKPKKREDQRVHSFPDDRRVQLCPRALSVLRRQLRLRASLKTVGKIDHDHIFFLETGEPIRNLQYPAARCRKTLQSLKLRYRRPYTARQTSVSWHLMVGGKNELCVAKQHGHSIATMLLAYAARAEGATEVDIEAIKRSMNGGVSLVAVDLSVAEALQARRASTIRPRALRRHALTDCSAMEDWE
ncbi:MAG: hypothetical protein ACJ8R9_08125 [Steroidobacteraceae bacterium]